MRRRLSSVIVWCIVAIAPFGVWVVRNILIVESLFGPIYPDNFAVIDAFHNITSQIALWIFGSTGLNFLGVLMKGITGIAITGYSTIAAIIFMSAILAYTVVGFGIVLTRYRPGSFRRNQETFSTCINFMLVYCLVLMIERPLSNGGLSIRYLIPLFPPLLVTVTVVLNEFISGPFAARSVSNEPPKIQLASTSVISLSSLWLALWIIPNYDSIVSWNDNGRGYRSSEWTESQVIEYLNNKPIDGVIWSNEHAALYFLTKSKDAEIYRLPLDLAETSSRVSANHYIVWFYWQYYHVLPDYNLEDLDRTFGLKIEAILKDGYILKIGSEPMDISMTWADKIVKNLLIDTSLILDKYFDVYIDYTHHRLIYIRRNICRPKDALDELMLYIFPTDRANLQVHQQRHQFNDLSFYFADEIIPIDNYCVAIRSIPSYDITAIVTGQQIQDGVNKWKGEYKFRLQ